MEKKVNDMMKVKEEHDYLKKKTRNYCFTLNNPTYNSHKEFYEQLFLRGTTYMIVGDEVGEQGTPHYQGYIKFANPRCISGLKKLDSKIHWEHAKGNFEQNFKYCSKDGRYTEFGERPKGQGARTDLKTITSMIDNGSKTSDILRAHEDKALRMLGNIEKAQRILNNTRRNWVMDVRIYYGAPGTGKTRAAYDEFDFDDIYPKMVGKWWDGYEGQKAVLIDDFDPGNCFGVTFDFYLRLLDAYPLMVEVKGGTTHFTSKTIIITSNYDPKGWFHNIRNRSAFFRRVSTIRHYIGDGSYELIDMSSVEQGTEVVWGNTVCQTTSGGSLRDPNGEGNVSAPGGASTTSTCDLHSTQIIYKY